MKNNTKKMSGTGIEKKFDVKEMANANIETLVEVMLQQIEENDGNWHKGWIGMSNEARNYVTNKGYSGGSNIFMLYFNKMLKPEILGETNSGYFVTQKQAFDLGWKLKDECKGWTEQVRQMQKDLEKMKEERINLYKEKKKAVESEKEVYEAEINRLSAEISELCVEIYKKSIWEQIIFFTFTYYIYHFEKGKYYYQTVEINSKGEIVKVISQKEISKEDYEAHDQEVVKKTFTTRYYNVANIEYYVREKTIKGRDLSELIKAKTTNVENANDNESFKVLTKYCNAEKIELKFKEQDRAYYSLTTDSITLPKIEQFDNVPSLVATFAHESIHSSGSKNRLARFEDKIENFETYSLEELVAETGSMFLLMDYGMLTDELAKNSFAYLKAYLNKCRENDSKSNLLYGINSAFKAKEFITKERN